MKFLQTIHVTIASFKARLCFLAALSLAVLQLTAAPPSTTSKKALKAYEAALAAYQQRDYAKTIKEVNAAIKADENFVEAHLLAGECYLENDDLKLAKKALLRCVEINADFFPPTYYSIADICLAQGEYDEAIGHLEKYLSYPKIKPAARAKAEKLLADSRFALKAKASPVAFEPENLNLDFPFDEYWPSLSVDGRKLIFTALIPIDFNHPDVVAGNRQEDFFVSDFVDGQWTRPKNLGSPPNTEDNEGAQAISADARRMFFTACNRVGGHGGCDIYYSEQRPDGRWSRPVNLDIVNTSAKETQPSIAPDGKTLYFVSDRRDGKGGLDIWRSSLDERGQWSAPVNMSELNTAYDESSPFIHFDNRTLYFASAGWPGMGQFDLFVTRLDSAGRWTQPTNLGYPVNSEHNEEGLVVNAAGDKAFYSSDRTEGNIRKIFSFTLDPAMRPMPASYLRGKIIDAIYQKPLKAKFELTNLDTRRVTLEASSDSVSGEFLVCLPVGGRYALNIDRPEYLFYSENITMGHGTFDKPVEQRFPLKRLKVGEKIILENIFFAFDSHELLDSSTPELQRLVQLMKNNPAMKIRITGHTDNVGSAVYNLTLSRDRAKAVVDYLIAAGVAAARLSSDGKGADVPMADNNSDEGRAKNRRTELEIIQ